MKRSELTIINNFKIINDNIDDQQKILCNKFHDTELSHTRKRKLLKNIQKFLKAEQKNYNWTYQRQWWIEKIQQELEFNGRINFGAEK